MPKVGGVVVTHGQLATELLNAAETIVGEAPHLTAVSIGWHDDIEVACELVREAIDRVNQGRGVILLTDMLGGTPTNIAATFLGQQAVEVITGVNLPMLIRLSTQSEEDDFPEVARRVLEQGRSDICQASEVLRPAREA